MGAARIAPLLLSDKVLGGGDDCVSTEASLKCCKWRYASVASALPAAGRDEPGCSRVWRGKGSSLGGRCGAARKPQGLPATEGLRWQGLSEETAGAQVKCSGALLSEGVAQLHSLRNLYFAEPVCVGEWKISSCL